MRLKHCYNFHDFRELARRRLPGPIFNYIDGRDQLRQLGEVHGHPPRLVPVSSFTPSVPAVSDRATAVMKTLR